MFCEMGVVNLEVCLLTRISIFNELPYKEMIANTKCSQKCYDHWYKWTYQQCFIFMKSQSLHDRTEKSFMIVLPWLTAFYEVPLTPLFAVTQHQEKSWDPPIPYTWRNYWTSNTFDETQFWKVSDTCLRFYLDL